MGTSGMMPLPGRNLTSVLLRRDGELFLFDCGEATQISLRRLNLKWKKISTIFISHTHADHVTGLPGILMLSSQVEREEPLTIIGPPKIREYVETSRKVLDMYINYEIIVKEIQNPELPGVVFENDELIIKSVPLRHSKVCVGYVFEEKPRPGVFHPEKAKERGVPCGPMWARLQSGESVTLEDGRDVVSSDVMGEARPGRKVAYITDTLWFPELASYLTGTDLLFCEAMFDESLADSAKDKKHLTASQAGQIAAAAGDLGQMGLLHFSPRYMDRELKLLKKEAAAHFSDTFLCRDRMVIDIPYPDSGE